MATKRDLEKQLHEKDLIIADLRAIIAKQNETIAKLNETITALRAEVADLKRQLGLDSSNSSMPPSSDGFKKPCRVQSMREKGGKKSGGQPGHKGSTLSYVEKPDYVEKVEAPHDCPHCKTSLEQTPIKRIQKQQVYEIPKIKAQVTEYQNEVKVCPGCHKTVTAQKEGILPYAPVQYGPNINTIICYLAIQNLVPEDRITQLMGDMFGLEISAATIESMVKRCATTVTPVVQKIAEQLQKEDVSCNDESGLMAVAQLRWLHTTCTNNYVYYRLSDKRGNVFVGLQGIVVHDHFQSYYSKLPNVQHALCNAHHLRELKAVTEIDKEPWAKRVSQLLLVGLRLTEKYPDGVPPRKIAQFRVVYRRLLARGFIYYEKLDELPQKIRGRTKRRPGHNLLLRLDTRMDDVLRFLENPAVPFTNNLAEQSLRMIKVKQKISGIFRTIDGANRFLTIRSYTATAKKQGQNVFLALSDACLGKPIYFC